MRILKERKAEKRKKDMSLRIKKIRAKRREKMGLPPESDSDSDDNDGDNNDDDDENEAEDITKSVMEGLKMFRRNNEEAERQRNQVQSKLISDWLIQTILIFDWLIQTLLISDWLIGYERGEQWS